MSYDRYLAICKPLHYSSIMTNNLPVQLAVGSWIISSITSVTTASLLSRLQFCGSNIIDHFYCDFSSLLELSCSDTSLVKMINLLQAGPLTIFPVVFITATYVRIFHTILRIPSTTGIKKAFSTCSSHLTVVCIFFVTLFTVYVIPSKGYSLTANKMISLLYTVVTPLLNPIIYSMRNHEIKAVIQRYVNANIMTKMQT
ncbi:olfactory receptor 1E16-like [Discoglossus pictus]